MQVALDGKESLRLYLSQHSHESPMAGSEDMKLKWQQFTVRHGDNRDGDLYQSQNGCGSVFMVRLVENDGRESRKQFRGADAKERAHNYLRTQVDR